MGIGNETLMPDRFLESMEMLSVEMKTLLGDGFFDEHDAHGDLQIN